MVCCVLTRSSVCHRPMRRTHGYRALWLAANNRNGRWNHVSCCCTSVSSINKRVSWSGFRLWSAWCSWASYSLKDWLIDSLWSALLLIRWVCWVSSCCVGASGHVICRLSLRRAGLAAEATRRPTEDRWCWRTARRCWTPPTAEEQKARDWLNEPSITLWASHEDELCVWEQTVNELSVNIVFI